MAKDKEHRKEYMANLRSLSWDDIQRQSEEAAEELFWMRFKNNGGQLEKPGTIKYARKKLARLNTILEEMSGEGEEATR